MIKFVIVEDDEKILEQVKKIISKASFKVDEEIEIKLFKKYDERLKKEINDCDSNKVYILDIDLKSSISGIEIAEKIREDDWHSEIIFMTNHDKMFETAHRKVLEVFDFIEKFHQFESKLEEDINKIFNKKFDKRTFTYHNSKTTLSLHFSKILYIYRDSMDRKLRIVTNTNNYVVSLTLQEILDRLDDRFKFVHRSCIANTEKIVEYLWKENKFILDNGEKVSLLSKKFKKELN